MSHKYNNGFLEMYWYLNLYSWSMLSLKYIFYPQIVCHENKRFNICFIHYKTGVFLLLEITAN